MAARFNDVESAKLLIKYGAAIEAKNNVTVDFKQDSDTPLHIAAKWDTIEIIKLLLEKYKKTGVNNTTGVGTGGEDAATGEARVNNTTGVGTGGEDAATGETGVDNTTGVGTGGEDAATGEARDNNTTGVGTGGEDAATGEGDVDSARFIDAENNAHRTPLYLAVQAGCSKKAVPYLINVGADLRGISALSRSRAGAILAGFQDAFNDIETNTNTGRETGEVDPDYSVWVNEICCLFYNVLYLIYP